MATASLTTTATTLDAGTAAHVWVLNTGTTRVTVLNGSERRVVRPGRDINVVPTGAVTALVTVQDGSTGSVRYDAPGVIGDQVAPDAINRAIAKAVSDQATTDTGTYAGIGLPSYALTTGTTRTKRYDPSRFLYNGRALRNWRAALSRQSTGNGVARLNNYGDSITIGYLGTPTQWQGSYSTRLRDKLATKFGNAGTGIVHFIDYSDDARIVKAGSWSILNGGFGPFDVAVLNAANSTSNTFAFTPDVQVSSFKVYYLTTNGSGTWNINVDGGANTPVAATAPNAPASVTISAGSLGTHTLNIIGAASNSTVLWAVEGTTGTTSGIRVTRCGKGGAKPGTLVGASPTSNIGSLQLAIDAEAPDLSTFMFGTNDFLQSETVAQFKADLGTLIARAQSVNSSVLLIPGPPDNNTALTPAQSAYVGAMYDLADTYDCAVYDVFDRWGSYAVSNASPISFYGDVDHPNNRGYQDIANGLYDIVVSG